MSVCLVVRLCVCLYLCFCFCLIARVLVYLLCVRISVFLFDAIVGVSF